VIGLQVVVLTPVLLVLGESLPKELFRVRADDLPYRLVRLVLVLRVLSLPVLWLVLGFARAVGRLAGAEARTVGDRRYRIASLLKEGAMHGAISPIQASLIDDAMTLARTPVGDLAVPMARLATVPVANRDEQLRAAARRAGTEPVVVVRSRGRVAALVDPLDIGLARVEMSEPFRVDASLGARDALAEMAEHGLRAAVVTRGGRDVGVITTRRLVRPLLQSVRPGTE
jgi:CBS domain containing-hemolysin-like protein